MGTALIVAAGALVVGLALGIVWSATTVRHLRRRVKELRANKRSPNPEDPAVERMSSREKAAYYQLLDGLERGEQPAPPVKRDTDRPETMKLVVWVCLAMGVAWVWCSYLLAWLDHPQIAESLSQVAVTEIIGVVLAYAIKSSIENLSKHNNWPDKGGPVETAPEDDPPAG